MMFNYNPMFYNQFQEFSRHYRALTKEDEEKQKFRHIPEIVMNRGEVDVIDAEIAEDYVEHIPMPPGLPHNRAGFKQFVQILRTAFPDLHYDVDHLTSSDLIGENQKVVHRITAHATHSGPWGPIPATGKKITWTEIHIGLYVQNMLVEHWGNIDTLGIMQQIGAIPGWTERPPVPPPPEVSGKIVTTYQENTDIVRRYVRELWNKGRLEAADEMVHPHGVIPSFPELPNGPRGIKIAVRLFREAFSHLYLFIRDVIAEEDVVAIRFTMVGTHEGPFMGIQATGRDVEMDGCSIFRFGDGRIIQIWQESDTLGLFGQLGVGGP
jgi:predicted ester cyclase